jgi:hypothetical protein
MTEPSPTMLAGAAQQLTGAAQHAGATGAQSVWQHFADRHFGLQPTGWQQRSRENNPASAWSLPTKPAAISTQMLVINVNRLFISFSPRKSTARPLVGPMKTT